MGVLIWVGIVIGGIIGYFLVGLLFCFLVDLSERLEYRWRHRHDLERTPYAGTNLGLMLLLFVAWPLAVPVFTGLLCYSIIFDR